MTKRYEIRAGTRAPCELVSISPINWSPDGVNVIFDGTYTACKRVADDLGVVVDTDLEQYCAANATT